MKAVTILGSKIPQNSKGSCLAQPLHLSWALADDRTPDPREAEPWCRWKRLKMQVLLLIAIVLVTLGAALGTASLVLSLFFRIMSKLR